MSMFYWVVGLPHNSKHDAQLEDLLYDLNVATKRANEHWATGKYKAVWIEDETRKLIFRMSKERRNRYGTKYEGLSSLWKKIR